MVKVLHNTAYFFMTDHALKEDVFHMADLTHGQNWLSKHNLGHMLCRLQLKPEWHQAQRVTNLDEFELTADTDTNWNIVLHMQRIANHSMHHRTGDVGTYLYQLYQHACTPK